MGTDQPDTGTQDQSEPDTGHPTEATSATDREPVDWQAEAHKWRDLARKHEGRAKANADAQRELDRLRHESMSEQERAVAEAAERARTDAQAEARQRYGAGLVAAELRAAGAGRLGHDQVDRIVGRLRVEDFFGADGELDRDAVREFVDGLVPPAEISERVPDLGQGARGAPIPLNGDPLLRDLKAKLGIT